MRRASLLALLALCASCQSLDDFATAEGEAFCGQITLGRSYRTGFSPRVQLRLRLDPGKLGTDQSPGSLSTYDGGGESSEPERLLDQAPLRTIDPLAHDALSSLEFGDGRERNLIYAVSPTGPQAESLLAIVSLRTDESVEVRLLRPGRTSDDQGEPDRGRQALFGMFLLHRRQDLCGF